MADGMYSRWKWLQVWTLDGLRIKAGSACRPIVCSIKSTFNTDCDLGPLCPLAFAGVGSEEQAQSADAITFSPTPTTVSLG